MNLFPKKRNEEVWRWFLLLCECQVDRAALAVLEAMYP